MNQYIFVALLTRNQGDEDNGETEWIRQLSLHELKQELKARRINCSSCVEKKDLRDLLREAPGTDVYGPRVAPWNHSPEGSHT